MTGFEQIAKVRPSFIIEFLNGLDSSPFPQNWHLQGLVRQLDQLDGSRGFLPDGCNLSLRALSNAIVLH